jgi:hypothetical protein
MSTGKVILLVTGVLVLLLTVGLLFAGGALVWVSNSQTDSDGFFNTSSIVLERDSYALVVPSINIDVETMGLWEWSDFFTLKVEGSSNDGAGGIFLGVARDADIDSYLNGVEYDEISRLTIHHDDAAPYNIEFTKKHGSSIPANPATQTFWIVSAHGTGTQSLEWSPETAGSYSIVLMNEDASRGVDFNVIVGAKVPLVFAIGLGLLGGGVVGLVIGGLMIYLAVRRP